MVEELAFAGIRNAEDIATCLNGYDQTAYPECTPWSFTRFYLPHAFDAGYRLTGDAATLWQAFEEAHHKASLPGPLDLPMESFARAVEIVLKDSELRDAPGYCPDSAAPVRKLFKPRRLRQLLRLPESVLDMSLLDASASDRYHPAFRFCRQCAAHGYHSVLYQLTDERRCPVHREALETLCRGCGGKTPFIINTRTIEAPFRCVACHSHFCYGRLPLVSTIPVMSRRERAEIRRWFYYG